MIKHIGNRTFSKEKIKGALGTLYIWKDIATGTTYSENYLRCLEERDKLIKKLLRRGESMKGGTQAKLF